MRLWHFATVFSLFTGSYSAQVAFDSAPPRTLVEALDRDPDYSRLVHLLKRARLIPTLNLLNDSTLFAPTNDAIERHKLWNSILEDSNFILTDNIEEKLRQQLFYHLLNYSISAFPEDDPSLQVHETLHYPHLPIQPPTREPPPYPPWMPVPGGTLGGEPQRLRVASKKEKAWVGTDASGKGGAEIVKGRVDAGNGVLLGIDDVLEPPPDLVSVLSQTKSVSYFHGILTPDIRKLLNTTSALTVFLPVNDAWEALDKYERIYLESPYATDDLNRILNMHAVTEDGVKWSDSFDPAINLTTIDGTKLEIVKAPGKTMISTAELVEPDIYASNGVLHLVSSLLIPPDAIKITPEKYLLSLHCTSFVDLIHDSELTSLINDTDTQYTILAPSDDVLSVHGGPDLPERGSEELKKMLQYHFIPGIWKLKKLKSGMLLETALHEPGLNNGSQMLSVEVGDDSKDDDSWKSLTFGGASVMREPIHLNNVLIYFVSKPVVPPVDALDTALPVLDLSSYIAAVLSTSIGEKLRNTPSTSLLIPHNRAFKRLGLLVSDHLLAVSKPDLEKVLLHHTLDTVQYAAALENGTQHTFATLEGSDVSLDRKGNGSITMSASGGWAGMKTKLHLRDTLTQTGVIHELSDILIPRSVELTIGKLVKAAKGSTMASLITKAGMDWVLNGTAPPEDSPWAEGGLGDVGGWTLLCPTDSAFKEYNLTELFEDKEELKLIVSQHLIPNPTKEASLDDTEPMYNNRPLNLDNSPTYSTIYSQSSVYGDVVFKASEDAEGGYIVGIKGARGTDAAADWARVMSWGRSTTGNGIGGVIQIDQVLVPYQPTWWIEYGAPLVVGAIGIIAICGFFYGVRLVWRIDTTEATYEPVGGFGREDDDDS